LIWAAKPANHRPQSRRPHPPPARQIILDSICTDRCLDADTSIPCWPQTLVFAGRSLLEYVEAPVDLSEIGGVNLQQWLASA
jgi:hypothetical protein